MLPNKPKPYEKIPQLARRLGVTRQTIWRWAQPENKLVEITRLGPKRWVRARLLPDLDK
jgi:predicted DNA-binding transcriptional regulator AlpA